MIPPFEKPILVTKPFLPPREAFMEGVEEIWRNVWLTNNGPLLQRLICRLQDYLRCENICLYANGTLALEIGLRALGVSGEVITTPFTFAATAHALAWNGLTPVFVDIEPEYYTLDPNKVEAAITPKTTAILAVHVFGYPCKLHALAEIARRHHLLLIYDAAHAFGVKVDGASIAGYGDLTMFSFHATKLYHTIEGGAVVFADAQWHDALYTMKNFGIISETEVTRVGINAKMNEFQALMGLLVLPYLDEIIGKRRELTNTYRDRLSGIEGIYLPPPVPSGVAYNYAYLPIEIRDADNDGVRDAVYAGLRQYNVHSRRYFYPLLTDFPCYQSARKADDLPVARGVASRILTLPLYYDLAIEDVNKICDIIVEILEPYTRASRRELVEAR